MMNDLCHARVAADDRLIEADERLIALNNAAGGGDRLVLPAVLSLCRLSRRLNVAISRPVRIADGDRDWEVWLRVRPDGDALRLTLADWRDRPAAVATQPAPTIADPSTPLLAEGFGEPLHRALDRPLSRIVATAETLRGAPANELPQTYRDYAADIATAGRHLRALIGDLTQLDEAEGTASVAREPVDLAVVAGRAIGLLRVRAERRAIQVTTSGQASATGDERRVLQIVTNLLGNAILYSPVGSDVELSVGSDDLSARLSVTNSGDMIAPSDQARIFDKFVRLGSGEPAGSGLGLYISQRLARAMAGDLMVDSGSGRTRFTLTLPVA